MGQKNPTWPSWHPFLQKTLCSVTLVLLSKWTCLSGAWIGFLWSKSIPSIPPAGPCPAFMSVWQHESFSPSASMGFLLFGSIYLKCCSSQLPVLNFLELLPLQRVLAAGINWERCPLPKSYMLKLMTSLTFVVSVFYVFYVHYVFCWS